MEEQAKKANLEKVCPHCNRCYRGEGFGEVCTSHCFYTKIYAERHKNRVKKAKNKCLKELPPTPTPQDKQRDRIAKSNALWATRTVDAAPKRQYNRIRALEWNTIYGDAGPTALKKFRAMRG